MRNAKHIECRCCGAKYTTHRMAWFFQRATMRVCDNCGLVLTNRRKVNWPEAIIALAIIGLLVAMWVTKRPGDGPKKHDVEQSQLDLPTFPVKKI